MATSVLAFLGLYAQVCKMETLREAYQIAVWRSAIYAHGVMRSGEQLNFRGYCQCGRESGAWSDGEFISGSLSEDGREIPCLCIL